MTVNEIEAVAKRLQPVNQAIVVYDAARPLNREARLLAGKSGALAIIQAEALELAEAKESGNLAKIGPELGDVAFGLADYFRLRGSGEYGREELVLLGGVVQWITGVEGQYGLDMTRCGVNVNLTKNTKNNPAMFFAEYHPLDSRTWVIDQNDLVRRGLRQIRKLDPEGILTDTNLEMAMRFWGYTSEAVKTNSRLAYEFISKVAVNGVKL